MTGPNAKAYEQSQLNWTKLRQYAVRVARETQAPRGTTRVVVQESRTREIRTGLFGLSRKEESFTVDVTKERKNDYWELAQRFWRKDEKGRGSQADETTTSTIRYCLGTDGRLFVLIESATDVYLKQGGFFTTHDSSQHPMTASDVLMFDFASKYDTSRGPVSIETNRDPDVSKLKYHAKGMGLSLALKQLLESR